MGRLYKAIVGRDDQFDYDVELSNGETVKLSFFLCRTGGPSILYMDDEPIKRWGTRDETVVNIDYSFEIGSDTISFEFRQGAIAPVPKIGISVNSVPVPGTDKTGSFESHNIKFWTTAVIAVIVCLLVIVLVQRL